MSDPRHKTVLHEESAVLLFKFNLISVECSWSLSARNTSGMGIFGPRLMDKHVLMLICCLDKVSFPLKSTVWDQKLPKLLRKTDTLTGPLPSSFSCLPLSAAPPLWVPSIFLGRRTKAKQPAPHRAVSHRPALSAPLPAAQHRDSSIVREGTTERRERNGWKWRDKGLERGMQHRITKGRNV